MPGLLFLPGWRIIIRRSWLHDAPCSAIRRRELSGMLRTAVATYLMVVTVLGPSLCCCALAPFASILPCRSVEKPAPKPCQSCCAHHQERPNRSLADNPIKPRPTRPGCPCRGELTPSAALP